MHVQDGVFLIDRCRSLATAVWLLMFKFDLVIFILGSDRFCRIEMIN